MKPEKIIAVRTSKTVYRDGDKMIKVFNEDYKLSDVLREAFNLSLVGETELKAQKFIEVSKIDGKWALVNEYIEGETLEQLIQKNIKAVIVDLDNTLLPWNEVDHSEDMEQWITSMRAHGLGIYLLSNNSSNGSATLATRL